MAASCRTTRLHHAIRSRRVSACSPSPAVTNRLIIRTAAVKFGETPIVPLRRPGMRAFQHGVGTRPFEPGAAGKPDEIGHQAERRFECANRGDDPGAPSPRPGCGAKDGDAHDDREQQHEPARPAQRQSERIANPRSDQDLVLTSPASIITASPMNAICDPRLGLHRTARDPAPRHQRGTIYDQAHHGQDIVEGKPERDGSVRDERRRRDEEEAPGRGPRKAAAGASCDLVGDGGDDGSETEQGQDIRRIHRGRDQPNVAAGRGRASARRVPGCGLDQTPPFSHRVTVRDRRPPANGDRPTAAVDGRGEGQPPCYRPAAKRPHPARSDFHRGSWPAPAIRGPARRRLGVAGGRPAPGPNAPFPDPWLLEHGRDARHAPQH